MGSAQRFEISPASFVHAGGQLDLAQMERFTVQTNAKLTRVRPGGSIHSLAFALSKAEPKIQFGTKDLATLFGTVSPTTGLCLTGAGTFRLTEREDCAAFLTGATHLTLAAARGFINPLSIEADIQSDDGAIAMCEFTPFGANSITNPIAINNGVDFAAAPVLAFDSLYYLGPVYHNAQEIKGVRRSTAEFGLTLTPSCTSPGPYYDVAAITDANPTLRFRVAKVDEAAAAANLFISAVNSNLSMYFYRSGNATDRAAVGSGTHLKVSCTAGSIEKNEIGGDAAQDAMVEFIVHPIGGIAINAASNIP